MIENRNLICIGCPLGCQLKICVNNGEIETITGYTCKRGEAYGRKEVTNPTRVVTSIVPVANRERVMVPLKTKTDIPKGKIMETMKELKDFKATAPIHIGDVLIENIAGTGIEIVATKEVL